MEKTKHIAEFKAPKQRGTRPFGYVIQQDHKGTYSVHTWLYEENSYLYGHYDMTYDQAAALFAEKVADHVKRYNPKTFDSLPAQAGYTQRVYLEGNYGELEVLTHPSADLDSEFRAWCLDEKEFITVKGWNCIAHILDGEQV